MKELLKTLLLGILIILMLTIPVVYFGGKVVKEIETVGLKNIVSDIWEGEEN